MYCKRIFDVSVALILLVALSPVLLLIALLVRLTSQGPVFFLQERVGYRGTLFTIIKFRTMKNGSGMLFDSVVPGDPRVTWVGRYLRSSHLDELPQLWNVVRGEMSLVGPRPMTPEYSDKLEKNIPGFSRRYEVLPGMTGLAQMREQQNVLEQALAHDLKYIERRSMALDILIMLKTVPLMAMRKGV